MKKLTTAIILAITALTLAACTSNDDSKMDDSDAVVETKAGNITKEEFYQALKAQNGEAVLQELVMRKILEDKYEVTEDEVNKEIKQLKENFGDQFEMVLQQNGFESEEDLYDVIYFNKLQEKAATEGVEVSEEEIEDYYNKLTVEVRASHILVDDEETANEVIEKLNAGEEFASLSEEYSNDTAANEEGGDLGFFAINGNMDPTFANAAYDLEVGEVSKPVQTQFGWHVIKVTDKRDAEDVGSLEDMRDEIRSMLVNEKVDQQALQGKIDQLVQDANIDVKIDEFKDLFNN
ncbi:peptidylprolyl isomerase [Salirhabdus salicampi]|uniref:peptidylprolyl isomerase n=1 Tax=Salirhabdus salicampi TaxID=476102 RepID=UPI0020C268A7|nr:peptidylprolyl isomerase [Salirhabdus salicampi]MCP8615497.1 peptidylprolyl isomerase [Salirhabdus salicampi]